MDLGVFPFKTGVARFPSALVRFSPPEAGAGGCLGIRSEEIGSRGSWLEQRIYVLEDPTKKTAMILNKSYHGEDNSRYNSSESHLDLLGRYTVSYSLEIKSQQDDQAAIDLRERIAQAGLQGLQLRVYAIKSAPFSCFSDLPHFLFHPKHGRR